MAERAQTVHVIPAVTTQFFEVLRLRVSSFDTTRPYRRCSFTRDTICVGLTNCSAINTQISVIAI
jgi:hypothetical protein